MSDAELKQRLGDYIAPPGLYGKTKDMPFLGTVSCNVDSIVAGSWQEIVIDYELGASGMADGLGAGDNTRAAVITRGLSEVTRMGVALGGDPLTFSGLAGMGDLVATCISTQSRNRHVGERLGKGETIEEIISAMNMVAEGVKTSKVVMELADDLGIDMPIASEVYGVCHGGRTAAEAYAGLLKRATGREMDGISPAR